MPNLYIRRQPLIWWGAVQNGKQKRAKKDVSGENKEEAEGSDDGGSSRLLSGGVQNDALIGAVVASGFLRVACRSIVCSYACRSMPIHSVQLRMPIPADQ